MRKNNAVAVFACLLCVPMLAQAAFALSISDVNRQNFTISIPGASVGESNVNFLMSGPMRGSFLFSPGGIALLPNGSSAVVGYSYADYLDAGSYNITIIAYSNATVATYNYQYVVPEIYNFTAIFQNISQMNGTYSMDLRSGQKARIDVLLSNAGNTWPSIIPYTNCSWIRPFDSSYQLNRNASFEALPVASSDSCEFRFNSTQQQVSAGTIRFSVLDESPPVINSFKLSSEEVEVTKPVSFIANVTDNANVSSVYVVLSGQYAENRVDLAYNADGRTFTGQAAMNASDIYHVTLYAKDSSGNGASYAAPNLNAVAISSGISGQSLVNFYIKKYGETSEKELLHLSDPYTVNVTLTSLTLYNLSNTNFQMAVKSNGHSYPLALGSSVLLTDAEGSVMIVVGASNNTRFEGNLDVLGPSYVNITRNVRFMGSLSSTGVPEPRTFYVLGLTINCEADLAQTIPYYVCKINYPIDMDPSTLTVPATLAQIDADHASSQKDVDAARLEQSRSDFWKNFFLAILIIEFLIIIYVFIVKPRWGGWT